MLIKLSGRALNPLGEVSAEPFVGRICTPSAAVTGGERERATEILLVGEGAEQPLPTGFRAYLLRGGGAAAVGPHTATVNLRDVYALSPEFDYLTDGDVVRIEPQRGAIHALYRRNSPSNSFLVTERCDNYCVMCSQPPKDRDDGWILDELIDHVIPLVSPETAEIGITGGEPGLLANRLVDLIACLRTHLPRTAVHVLSNGRAFANERFAKAVASVKHPDLMIGIPLYGEVAEVHDYVVQARGAFDQTLRGILNLKRQGVQVELRFVIHADTCEGLPSFARFVTRNLLFVDHVALMGLELMGFARANLERIWVDPVDYQAQLLEAVETLDRAGMNVSVYNHQLCVLDPELHRFARQSISDWKNAYVPECESCELRPRCGGFFASSDLRRSRGIRPVGSM